MEKNIKIREMNKEIFQNNLVMTLKEIFSDEELNLENIRFKISPVEEKGKGYDAKDDIMRLVLLSEKNIGGRFLLFDSAVSMLTSFVPFVPIWINVSFQKKEDEVYFFELETSYRIRKPSLLRNVGGRKKSCVYGK